MSALGQMPTFYVAVRESALPSKADIQGAPQYVCLVPRADILPASLGHVPIRSSKPLGPKEPGQVTPAPTKLTPRIDLPWFSDQALSEKYSLSHWYNKAISPVAWAGEAAKLEQNWI